MKILHISKYYPPEPGGIESFVRDLAESQVASGYQVRVLGHASGKLKTGSPQTLNRIEVIRVCTWGQLAYAPVAPSFPVQLSACLKAFQPDVIHVHMPNPSAFWLLFLRRLPPIIVHWHADVSTSDLDPKMKWLYALYRPFEKWLLLRARSIICTSQPYLESSPPLLPFKAKCSVIPLGLNPQRFTPEAGDQETLPSGASKLFILSVGRFAYYKGFANLIQAAFRLPEIQVCIAGQGQDYGPIRQLVHRLDMSQRVALPGPVSDQDLKKLFWSCDLFCLPSIERTEAFGMVLLEAMCCGKPLLTTDIPGSGVTMVNQAGQTGLQARVNDPDALAEAIQQFLQKPELLQSMGRRARERFDSHFHIEQVASQIEAVYTRHLAPEQTLR